jgi:hypothetical protein
MSAELFEAFTSDFSVLQVFQTGMGFLKLGDLGTDILFIVTMAEYNGVFGDAVSVGVDGAYHEAVNVPAIIGVSVFFTLVGFVYDIFKARAFLQLYREEKECSCSQALKDILVPKMCRSRDGDQKEAESEEDDMRLKMLDKKTAHWWHTNVLFEEIPQCFILAWVLGSILESNKNCDEVTCTQEEIDYTNELVNSCASSLALTAFSLLASIAFYMRVCFRKIRKCCVEPDDDKESIHRTRTADTTNEYTSSSAVDPSLGGTFAPSNTNNNGVIREVLTESVYSDDEEIQYAEHEREELKTNEFKLCVVTVLTMKH